MDNNEIANRKETSDLLSYLSFVWLLGGIGIAIFLSMSVGIFLVIASLGCFILRKVAYGIMKEENYSESKLD